MFHRLFVPCLFIVALLASPALGQRPQVSPGLREPAARIEIAWHPRVHK
jgi:hypothetical protein